MDDKEIKKLRSIAQRYFNNEENHPFSMLEICGELGVGYDTLCGWGREQNPALVQLASSIKARVGAELEKGNLSPGLSSYLHKHYFPETAEGPAPEPLSITIRVLGEEGGSDL